MSGISFTSLLSAAEDNSSYAAEINTIYVSPDGDDSNAGTEEKPLKTLEAAKAAARTGFDGTGDIEIILRGGEYNISETVRFTSEDGGRNGHRVIWKGYENETPVISGMIELTDPSLYDADKNIYRISVPEGFNTRQLYINGKKALRARNISYSGNTYDHLKRTCELGLNSRNNRELYFYRDDIENPNNFENVEVHLLTAWTDNLLRFEKYDAENNFKPVTVDNGDGEGVVDAAAVKLREPESGRLFNRPHPDITGSTLGYRSRSYYYLENAYEFIDEDNEWYLDVTEDMIYYKAPADLDMSNARITAPALETLISIDGSDRNRVCDLSFENIVFEGSTWTRPSEEGLVGGQASQYVLTSDLDNNITVYHPPGAFYAQYADNLNITGCTFRKAGSTAVDLYCGVTNSNIFGNEIYDVAGNGISAAKFVLDENTEFHEAYNPKDKSEICENINIINNAVYDIGTEYEGAVAIVAGYPKNIVIAHNEIYNAPYSGISVGFGWTAEDNAMERNIIFANRIHNVGLVTCDFGAIYTLSKQPQSLCARNCIYDLSYKPWFDYGYAVMYFDERTEGYTIKENLTYGIGAGVWGNGMNFNGCKDKNTTVDNYLNVDPGANESTAAVFGESGIVTDRSCTELAEEAREYLDDILNPEEKYDETDYYIYKPITPKKATATAADSASSAEFAIDGRSDTVYTLSGQTANSMADQYLLIEFDDETVIDRIVIDRQYNAGGMTSDNSYWADWCLAVGCELQGSVDGENWETIGVMNTWPDDTGETKQEIFELKSPRLCKYVRYIRTKYKTGSDYGVWRWSSSDGGNRLNMQEISFYGKTPVYAVDIVKVSAAGCDADSRPEYAADKDRNTVYTLSGQTADSISEQYLLLELSGKETLDKIIIRRQYNAGGMTTDNNYWADWCLAVGCELQGSFDGKSWETIGIMNTWPDGTGDISKDIFEFDDPQMYKYVRYIRTKYKTGSDYAVWRWPFGSGGDGGNRLNIKEIELYTTKKEPGSDETPMPGPDETSTPGPDETPMPRPDVKPRIEAEITSLSAESVSVRAQSNTDGEYKMITAVYDENGALLFVKINRAELEKDIPKEITVDIKVNGDAAVFFWKDDMTPVSEKIKYS
ncbi:MAG: discoidin domain-containing protein [Oscillospiraceae bacterium]|nr:discoidin domain-containing protein [Oscillospiraceae bacterium]